MKRPSWAEAPERGAVWTMRLLLFSLNLFGYPVVRVFLFPIVAYFVITGRVSRQASRRYLTLLHRFDPRCPKASLFQIYRHHLEFALSLVDRVLLWQGQLKGFRFTGTGKELIEQQRPTGCLLIGAHLGSFDVLRLLVKDMTCRVNVVMYRSHARRFNELLQKLNPEANVRVIELSEGDNSAILEMKKCFDQGEHIAILGDRLTPNLRERSCKVSFLGEEAAFPVSPWLLASIFNCPVILVLALRTGARSYHICVEQLADTVKRDQQNLTKMITEYVRRLEAQCREYPRQWFNFYDFWDASSRDTKSED